MKTQLFLLLLTVPLFYCSDPERLVEDRSIRQKQKIVSSVYTLESESYYGEYSSSDYNGDNCDNLKKDNRNRYNECKNICRKIYHKESRLCEKLPTDLISKLDRLYKELFKLRVRENTLNTVINDFDFGVMIDIHIESMLNLIHDWSVREVTDFLILTASNPAIALALQEHDTEDEILKKAFKKLTKNRRLPGDSIKQGISTDLKSFGETFWVIAEKKKNKAAFILMHRFVTNICTDKSCKLDLYCLREEFSRSQKRNQQPCYYSTKRGYVRQCYIHGPDVWNYWESLNQEGEFSDSDFLSSNKKYNFTEEICDKNCKRKGASCRRSYNF